MNNPIPNNAEHFEALQNDVNVKRAQLLADAPAETQQQMEIIEKAVRMLADNGIACALFAQVKLPIENSKDDTVMFQYNTLAETIAPFGANGRQTLEGAVEVAKFYNRFSALILAFYTRASAADELTHEEMLHRLKQIYHQHFFYLRMRQEGDEFIRQDVKKMFPND